MSNRAELTNPRSWLILVIVPTLAVVTGIDVAPEWVALAESAVVAGFMARLALRRELAPAALPARSR